MILDWFDARNAVACGHSLADAFLRDQVPAGGAHRRSVHSSGSRAQIQTFLQRAAREARPLRLNVFKRAKLIGSFKWRLLEAGVEPDAVEELTHLLLLQLSGGAAVATERTRLPAPSEAQADRSRRVPALLADADARFAQGAYAQAAELLEQVIGLEPRHAFAHNKLGASLARLGHYAQADEHFRRAIELKSNFADPYFNHGLLLFWRGDIAASETALRRAVKLDPKNDEALVSLGVSIGSLGRFADSRECFEKALRLKPGNARALSGLGWLESVHGRGEAAEQRYRQALQLEPGSVAALTGLGELRRMSPADREWAERVKTVIAAGVPPIEEVSLRFALGKYFDDIGRFADAFAEFKRANELHKLVARGYDRGARTEAVDDVIRAYDAERMAVPPVGAEETERPVFVVGMMRSGTSLVEQIIASHPQASGAGELDFWHLAASKQPQIARQAPPDAPLARKLGAAYLKVLKEHSDVALRVVDKSTFNADYLGLIHRVFPRARFIHVRRDPLDTCLSCYCQHFVNAMSFTMDLADLAHYYREYHRLMAHWRSVLPSDLWLEVPYSQLVADQEGWSRRIIEFLGLSWDPRVLEFQKTERVVLTASNWQVRQKIYSSSVGRWKNYQKFIGPLLPLRDLTS